MMTSFKPEAFCAKVIVILEILPERKENPIRCHYDAPKYKSVVASNFTNEQMAAGLRDTASKGPRRVPVVVLQLSDDVLEGYCIYGSQGRLG